MDDRSALTFASAAELYIADMRALGRLTTDRSAHEYRRALHQHAADAGTTDPRATTRDDVKLTLRRWSHPNPAPAALHAGLVLRLDGRGVPAP